MLNTAAHAVLQQHHQQDGLQDKVRHMQRQPQTHYTLLVHELTQRPVCEMQIEASIQELAQEGMEARLAAAQAARDQSQAAVEEAGAAVEAAERELAGAQAGDGRDQSNRSLQERLADAQNAQARLWAQGWLSWKTCLTPTLAIILLSNLCLALSLFFPKVSVLFRR